MTDRRPFRFRPDISSVGRRVGLLVGGLLASVVLAGLLKPPASVAVQADDAIEPLPGLLEDLGRLRQSSNDARFEVLIAILEERGIPYEVQEFANERTERSPRSEGRNIVMTFGSGTRDLVVGAHFDAVALPEGFSEGMVDNGAGAIIVTRVAEALQKRKLNHRVRVVLFDMEEIGLLGSRHYASTEEAARTAAMINLDIAAAGDAVLFGPGQNQGNGVVYDAAWQVCANQDFSCVEFPVYPSSDDRSFQRAGVPNISIAVMPEVEAHQMWLIMNARDGSGLVPGFRTHTMSTIHSPADTLDEAQPEAMTLAYQMVLETLLYLDSHLPGDQESH